MKNAVIIGAGNIGRGFIGQIFSDAGYEIVFLDVAAPLVDALNAAGAYPLELVSSDSAERRIISPVRAVNGRDPEAAARTIADADVLVTCVGAKALKFIVPNLTAGVRLRAAESGKPLNLLICENLMDADAVLRGLIDPHLTESEKALLGLVETSVGRMVPHPDKELLEKSRFSRARNGMATFPMTRMRGSGTRRTCPHSFPARRSVSWWNGSCTSTTWDTPLPHTSGCSADIPSSRTPSPIPPSAWSCARP